MANEKTTNEIIEVFTNYFDVAQKPTNENDYEKRVRFYSQKSARNYEELRKKYEVIEIHYFKNDSEIALENLVKLDASKVNLLDIKQVMDFNAKLQTRLEMLKVKSANIRVYQELQTGAIIMSKTAVVNVVLE